MGDLEFSPTPVARGKGMSVPKYLCVKGSGCAEKTAVKSSGGTPRKIPGVWTRRAMGKSNTKQNFQMTQWDELHTVRINKYYGCH